MQYFNNNKKLQDSLVSRLQNQTIFDNKQSIKELERQLQQTNHQANVSISDVIHQQPFFFIFITGLFIYSTLTYYFICSNEKNIVKSSYIQWRKKQVQQEDQITKQYVDFVKKNQKIKQNQEARKNFNLMRQQYLTQMSKKEYYDYTKRRRQLQDQRYTCEDHVFRNYLSISQQKYFTKDQLLSIAFQVHKQVREWPQFKENIFGEPIHRFKGFGEADSADRQFNQLQQEEYSDEETAKSYKKQISKKLFNDHEIEDNFMLFSFENHRKQKTIDFCDESTFQFSLDRLNKIRASIGKKQLRLRKNWKDQFIIQFDQNGKLLQ